MSVCTNKLHTLVATYNLVMHDSDSGIGIDSGMIPLLTGIGIGIKHLENSGFQGKPGIGIGIRLSG